MTRNYRIAFAVALFIVLSLYMLFEYLRVAPYFTKNLLPIFFLLALWFASAVGSAFDKREGIASNPQMESFGSPLVLVAILAGCAISFLNVPQVVAHWSVWILVFGALLGVGLAKRGSRTSG